jgi:parvulin-like peptidyl-prolyl isomerase
MKKSFLGFVAGVTILASTTLAQEKVYAIVNGQKITKNDIAVALRDPRINFDRFSKEQQKQIINSIIDQTLLMQYAYKTNITKTKEYKQELEKLKQNLAYQLWMRDLTKEVKISQKELKDFYNKNKSKFVSPMQLKASHILVKTKQEAIKLIQELKKAKNIKATFTKLAKKYSVGPSGANGGELGWFAPKKMVPEFSQAASKLKKGSFTLTPVKTQFGYHIIYLDDKKDQQTISFKLVQNKLKEELMKIKFLDKLKQKAQQLRKKSKIILK